jgi:hypothetical protein
MRGPYICVCVWSVGLLALSGCLDGLILSEPMEPEPGSATSVVDNTQWELTPLGADPWPQPEASRIYCEEDGYGYENPVFEIKTQLCDGRAFEQPLKRELIEGEFLHLVFWHSSLIHDRDATAEVGIAIGEDILWEIDVPIPFEETAYRPYIQVEQGYLPGDRLSLRVLNHGDNSWNFLDFTTGTEEVYPDM